MSDTQPLPTVPEPEAVPPPKPARLRPADILRVGAEGLRARRSRVVLSALGIAIGIATMVAVVGISSSSRADVLAQLDRLGTNLLTADANAPEGKPPPKLPKNVSAMVERIRPVETATDTAKVEKAEVRRSDAVPVEYGPGVGVQAARPGLLEAVSGRVAKGKWLDSASERLPSVALGAVAAQRLGVHEPGAKILVNDQWFVVTGILAPVELVPLLDRFAFTGFAAAERYLGFDGHPTTVYSRSQDSAVPLVQQVMARTVNPGQPGTVQVSRPSDALAAKAATDKGLQTLMLGLGAVALLVGGVGVANTMVVSVLERRPEIGLRRALGATRGSIRSQFLCESLLLSALGGVGGAVLGALATVAFASAQGWTPVVPPWALVGGFGATLFIGVLAGLYPATRAARLEPTRALAAV